jgi:hypothetical protein
MAATERGGHAQRPPEERTAIMAEGHDVVDLLTEDHRRIEGLLERLDDERDPVELRAIYLRIVGELAAHEACEQQVVYPVLRATVAAAGAWTAACCDQHEEINSLLDEMRGLDPSCLGFVKRASALLLELEAHFAGEEELFARLRTTLAPADLVALADRALAAKACAPAFPPAADPRPAAASS